MILYILQSLCIIFRLDREFNCNMNCDYYKSCILLIYNNIDISFSDHEGRKVVCMKCYNILNSVKPHLITACNLKNKINVQYYNSKDAFFINDNEFCQGILSYENKLYLYNGFKVDNSKINNKSMKIAVSIDSLKQIDRDKICLVAPVLLNNIQDKRILLFLSMKSAPKPLDDQNQVWFPPRDNYYPIYLTFTQIEGKTAIFLMKSGYSIYLLAENGLGSFYTVQINKSTNEIKVINRYIMNIDKLLSPINKDGFQLFLDNSYDNISNILKLIAKSLQKSIVPIQDQPFLTGIDCNNELFMINDKIIIVQKGKEIFIPAFKKTEDDQKVSLIKSNMQISDVNIIKKTTTRKKNYKFLTEMPIQNIIYIDQSKISGDPNSKEFLISTLIQLDGDNLLFYDISEFIANWYSVQYERLFRENIEFRSKIFNSLGSLVGLKPNETFENYSLRTIFLKVFENKENFEKFYEFLATNISDDIKLDIQEIKSKKYKYKLSVEINEFRTDFSELINSLVNNESNDIIISNIIKCQITIHNYLYKLNQRSGNSNENDMEELSLLFHKAKMKNAYNAKNMINFTSKNRFNNIKVVLETAYNELNSTFSDINLIHKIHLRFNCFLKLLFFNNETKPDELIINESLIDREKIKQVLIDLGFINNNFEINSCLSFAIKASTKKFSRNPDANKFGLLYLKNYSALPLEYENNFKTNVIFRRIKQKRHIINDNSLDTSETKEITSLIFNNKQSDDTEKVNPYQDQVDSEEFSTEFEENNSSYRCIQVYEEPFNHFGTLKIYSTRLFNDQFYLNLLLYDKNAIEKEQKLKLEFLKQAILRNIEFTKEKLDTYKDSKFIDDQLEISILQKMKKNSKIILHYLEKYEKIIKEQTNEIRFMCEQDTISLWDVNVKGFTPIKNTSINTYNIFDIEEKVFVDKTLILRFLSKNNNLKVEPGFIGEN
ncbi:hypothetical protein NUSPORA_00784 [Nucleospora cyclopteri]